MLLQEQSSPVTVETEKLSKRAQKRLKKRQEWLDTKTERKEIQKQKRKLKIEQYKAEGKFEISNSGESVKKLSPTVMYVHCNF